MEEPFPHVVASLAPHTVKAGQVAEVELKPGGVWPVRVLAVFYICYLNLIFHK